MLKNLLNTSNAADNRDVLIFAALGDETRLFIIETLCQGPSRSISQLTEGSKLTKAGNYKAFAYFGTRRNRSQCQKRAQQFV